jgi:hypothetical protein
LKAFRYIVPDDNTATTMRVAVLAAVPVNTATPGVSGGVGGQAHPLNSLDPLQAITP